jgi:hypothetical protein
MGEILARGVVRLFEDDEPAVPLLKPGEALADTPELILRGNLAVGYTDQDGDHFYAGFGPE